jgi:2,4-dienoyl-CoA reductase-like NADH-dependent reductase (Old Yellow Enzyme family)
VAASAFPTLFSPITLGGTTIRNRILSTGHDTAMAHDGQITDRLVAYQEARAEGGVGLIVVQVAGVHETARYTSHVLMADTDDCITGYRKLAAAIHRHGAKVVGQLFHPGREVMEGKDGATPPAYAPSAVPNRRFRVMPIPMSAALIADVVAGYGQAAQRMEQAGLDGAEIVASMGYLPAQFLNPGTNRRADRYGGSLDNRLRFVREVVASIRAKTGPHFTLGIRISGDDMDSDTIDPTEVVEICRRLDQDGELDYFNVIAGSSATLQGAIHIVPPMAIETAYVVPFAAGVKAVVGKPVLVAGRINQPQIAEKVIASGQADMCGMTRAMIADPEMPNKARTGRAEDIRACIACNQACIHHFHRGYAISCIQHPETGRELTHARRPPAAPRKRVVVAGGGPAGLKAAAVAAERGHEVTLYERSGQLGGQVLLAQLLPRRAEFGGLATNLARECELAGVEIFRSTEADRALIERTAPDVVIIATGGKPHWPEFEGRDSVHVVDAWQVLEGRVNVGHSVVIAEWRPDWIGVGLAEKLRLEGCRVRLCVEGIAAGELLPWYVRDQTAGVLHELGVEIVPYARLYGADGTTIYFQHAASGAPLVMEEVDTLVLSQGHARESALETALADMASDVTVIGDALAPRTVEEAVLEGLEAALRI